jgi:phosphatidylinositol alpha-1,6-mannosyltransferase
VSAALWQVLQRQKSTNWELVVAAPNTDTLSGLQKLSFALRVLWRQLRRKNDLLFFDHLGLARVQRLVPSRYRRPYGIFLHSIEAWNPLSASRLNALCGAALLVANSHYTAARVMAMHPSAGRIQVCPLSLGIDRENPSAEKISPDEELRTAALQIRRNSVLIVGRMMRGERHKGHDELLHTWRLVLRDVPDAQLVIVGGGDDLERYRTLVADLRLSENVLFLGRVSESVLNAVYSSVALFAMPSRAEGFGVAYLEAMAHKLACIASVHDAAGEIVVDGETGFLVDQAKPAELASKVVALLVDPVVRNRFGQAGYQRLRSHFSFDQFESRVNELLSVLRV